MSKRYGTPDQRFDALYIPEPNSGCWLWLGRLDHNGYGQFSHGQRRSQAHRWSYERLVGPIPDGLQIDHLCRVRSCVNPVHLEPVTQRENIIRGIGTSAVNARKTTCPKGHSFTAKWGHSRRCRECHNAYRRLWEAGKKANV